MRLEDNILETGIWTRGPRTSGPSEGYDFSSAWITLSENFLSGLDFCWNLKKEFLKDPHTLYCDDKQRKHAKGKESQEAAKWT